MDWPVQYRRKVRYSDTDAQGIVFNGNYLRYYDDALTDLVEIAGLGGANLHAMGCDVVTAHVSIDFKAPARLGDVLVVGVRFARTGTTSLEFAARSWIETTSIVTTEGRVIWVCVDPETLRPIAAPPALIEALQNARDERSSGIE
jgi:YbgC/YbaW family acyl-CoA thioester hydrolase